MGKQNKGEHIAIGVAVVVAAGIFALSTFFFSASSSNAGPGFTLDDVTEVVSE